MAYFPVASMPLTAYIKGVAQFRASEKSIVFRIITKAEADRLGSLAWFVFTPSGIQWRTNVGTSK